MLEFRSTGVKELTNAQKQIMYELLEKHFDNCSYSRFLSDLAEKEGVILLYDDRKQIRGYSTYLYYQVQFQAERTGVLFSGDTIIHKEHWGDSALFKGFFAVLKEKMRNYPGIKFYWFLISKGIRTYLLLPLFYRIFYPHYREATPPAVQDLIHRLGELKFGTAYCRKTGIIHSQGDSLNRELSEIPECKVSNPHVNFFLEKNPGWQKGDELACLTEVSYRNFKPIVKRLMESTAVH